MGRKESEISDSAMLIYPAMQSADIFAMDITIAHAGTDQRNVHVVAREASAELEAKKPIAIHHHLLQGLLKPEITGEQDDEAVKLALKMSKSKPDSAVFITDSPEEIKRKVNGAYAPEAIIELNPILDWTKYLIFYQEGSNLTIKRDEKWGGDLNYKNYEDLEKDYAEKKLHPMDLKNAVADWLIEKLAPAREYFEDPARKSALEEITTLTQ